jgi:hypothetical protein
MALVAVRYVTHHHPVSRPGIAGQRASAADLQVIRVTANGENIHKETLLENRPDRFHPLRSSGNLSGLF